MLSILSMLVLCCIFIGIISILFSTDDPNLASLVVNASLVITVIIGTYLLFTAPTLKWNSKQTHN